MVKFETKTVIGVYTKQAVEAYKRRCIKCGKKDKFWVAQEENKLPMRYP